VECVNFLHASTHRLYVPPTGRLQRTHAAPSNDVLVVALIRGSDQWQHPAVIQLTSAASLKSELSAAAAAAAASVPLEVGQRRVYAPTQI